MLHTKVIIKYYILILAITAISTSCFAQKYIQLEKKNSMNLVKFHIGDEMTYQTLFGGRKWYKSKILGLDRDQGIVYFEKGIIKFSQIKSVKTFRNRKWSTIWAYKLRLFAVSWNVYALADAAYGDADWKINGIVAGSSIGLSIPLEVFFKSKKHKLHKKRFNLRMMDLTIDRDLKQ